MKTLLFLFPVLLLSCLTKETVAQDRSIGFLTAIPDSKWHLGTEAAIQVVKDLDKVWGKYDYAAMKTFFVDTAKFYFPDGNIANSPDDFIAIIKKQREGVEEDSWTFDFAYSVDLDPSVGGEHVQAGFTGTTVKGGVKTKTSIHESYYIIQGKIVWWIQHEMDIKDVE